MNTTQNILILGARLYRGVISPAKLFLFGPLGQCRFTPSCSAYAVEAITRHGALSGCWLALKRLGRCHPWGGCGEDPVPESASEALRQKVGVAPATTDPLGVTYDASRVTRHTAPIKAGLGSCHPAPPLSRPA
ncbi:MAG TPA: membrane protein insertion efficiency factor YidD [Candidatus Binatia bacterium]|nr:membrane protein insertion efficiency factor YidD [Candidatus Binatia bacterium]